MTVLGHYPGYLRLSDELGAHHFEVTLSTWNALGSRQEQWAENRHFLDRTIDRGDPIVLSTLPENAVFGSFFSMELLYLKHKGKRIVLRNDICVMR